MPCPSPHNRLRHPQRQGAPPPPAALAATLWEEMPSRITTESARLAAGKGRCGTATRTPPAQPAYGERPSLARLGKSRKIDFCFSTVCRVFIDPAAAGVSIRVTRRELDQELLYAQPGAFLGWVNLPVNDARRLGRPAARGRGAESGERDGVPPFRQKLRPGTAWAGSM